MFRVKTDGAAPYQDAYDSPFSSELLPFGEEIGTVPYSTSSHPTHKSEQNNTQR